MSLRRLTILTNGFSKKLENLKAAIALYYAYCNFVRVQQSLRVTPRDGGGVEHHVWTVKDTIQDATVIFATR
jgi:hypothetical protein